MDTADRKPRRRDDRAAPGLRRPDRGPPDRDPLCGARHQSLRIPPPRRRAAAALRARRACRPASAQRARAQLFADRRRGPSPATYTFGIKRDPASRGGSRYIHDELRVGRTLKISAPRNNFRARRGRRAHDADRRRHRHHADLVHGAAARRARSARGSSTMPAARAPTWRSSTRWKAWRRRAIAFRRRERGQIPRHRRHRRARRRRTRTSIAAARRRCSTPSRRPPRTGRASRSTSNISRPQGSAGKKGGFTVELARSGQEFFIPEGQTILDVLLDEGVDVDYSCELGICGACEQRVISGMPGAPRLRSSPRRSRPRTSA